MFLSYNLTNLNNQKRFFLIFEDLKRNPIQKDARKLASIKGNSLNKTLAKRNDFALPFSCSDMQCIYVAMATDFSLSTNNTSSQIDRKNC